MIPMIPPSTAETYVAALSEIVDWGQNFTHVCDYRINNGTLGAGVNVAVLDSGIAKDHPDLKNNVVSMVDFTGDTRPFHPHGTHVAGIIAASADDAGVIGVAPEAKLHSLRVLDADGLCPSDYRYVIQALEWVRDHPEIDIVNISLGSPIPGPERMKTIISELVHRGVIIVAASGNDRAKEISYPARYDDIISVAAMDKDGNIANFSNVGQSLDVVAPGVDIYSTWVNGGFGYAKESGTSMSAPFISGLLALMLSYHRNGGEHETPLTNYLDAIAHLQTFQDGMLVSGIPGGIGVGITKATTQMAKAKTVDVITSKSNSVPNWRMTLYVTIDKLIRRIILGPTE